MLVPELICKASAADIIFGVPPFTVEGRALLNASCLRWETRQVEEKFFRLTERAVKVIGTGG
jgi:hypothetical protein